VRIACIGYREWALRIYDHLSSNTDHQFIIFRNKEQYDESTLDDFKPDIVLFYGWSWLVSSKLIKRYTCLMLHPSALPAYRGGSPIQNQIIRNKKTSAVTIFVMDEGLDAGPILAQKSFSLTGSMSDVLDRVTSVGLELTIRLLNEGLSPIPQNHASATTYRRLNDKDNEITIDEIHSKSAEYLYNKIRMLQSPYPGAYILTVDGKRLVITDAYILDEPISE